MFNVGTIYKLRYDIWCRSNNKYKKDCVVILLGIKNHNEHLEYITVKMLILDGTNKIEEIPYPKSQIKELFNESR